MQDALEVIGVSAVQARLDDLEQRLADADRLAAVGLLAAGIAHEVNNQLTPAMAYAQMLRCSLADPIARDRALDRIIAGIDAASRILSTVLGLASPSSHPGRASVEAAAREAIECLGPDPSRDGIEITVSVEPDLAAAIDPMPLQQVLLNLLVNARRALRSRGGGAIAIQGRRLPGACVEIVVRDNGPGVPVHLRDRLFSAPTSRAVRPGAESPRHERAAAIAGHQPPQPPHPAPGGHGIGLTVCHRLVASAQGSIVAEHPDEGGALFRIQLRAAPPQRARKAG